MPFSASTCLSYIGTTVLTNPLLLYSNSDNYSTSFGSVLLSDITGENCPTIITNIPNGSTRIKILSNNLNCIFIDISCDKLCANCNLTFSNLNSLISVGKISAGVLTGSCQSTDYIINWYGPDSTTRLAFTSGIGTTYDYGYRQPFIDLLSEGGVYRPKLQKIIFSGITFSSTGGTNQVLADLDCLPNLQVNDFSCDNGVMGTNFSHTVSFTSQSNNTKPESLSGRFLLSGNTSYFGISFAAYSISDTLQITYSGSNYNTPIVLENMRVGNNSGAFNVSATTIPKVINYSPINKLLCLTGLTRSPDDFLKITVTPNTGTTDTSWSLSLKCLGNIDRTIDGYINYTNQPFKISADTIGFVESSCNGIRITGKTVSSITGVAVYPYVGRNAPGASTVNFSSNWDNNSVIIYPGYSGCSFPSTTIGNWGCTSTIGTTIIFNKTYTASTSASTTTFEFSNQAQFNSYYNSALEGLTYSGSTNRFDLQYYRYLRFYHHVSSVNSSTLTLCGTDNISEVNYYFHPATMVITTGTTPSGNYVLSIGQVKLPTAYNFNYSVCELNCQSSVNSVVNTINNSAESASYSYTTTVGLRAKKPIAYYWYVTAPTYVNSLGSLQIFDSYVQYSAYANVMYPYSGTSTLIPSLSAISSSDVYSIPIQDGTDIRFSTQRLAAYQVRLTNPSNRRDFEIWGRPVVNYIYSGTTYELAYRYSGGTEQYRNSYYII